MYCNYKWKKTTHSGEEKKCLPTNFYKWIRSWIFSKGKDVTFGCWREKDLGCALFGGAKNKKSSHRKGFVRQLCLRTNRQIGKQGISKLVTGDTHQNSVQKALGQETKAAAMLTQKHTHLVLTFHCLSVALSLLQHGLNASGRHSKMPS